MTEQRKKPWLEGIVDTLVGARLLQETTIPHRNRLVVILLDSAFETGCRAYLRHEVGIRLDAAHRHREALIKTMMAKLSEIDEQVWKSINYYYEEIRCDFYHESASKTLTESALLDYRDAVYFVIDSAFSVSIAGVVDGEYQKLRSVGAQPQTVEKRIPWDRLTNRTDKVLAAVGAINPRNNDDVNTFFKKEGVSLRLTPAEFTNVVARNNGSKNLFFYNREQRRWELSGAGRFRFSAIPKEENQ